MHKNRTPVIYRTDLKTVAAILFCLCALLCALCLVTVSIMSEYGFYTQSFEYTEEKIFSVVAQGAADRAADTIWGSCLSAAARDESELTDREKVEVSFEKRDRILTPSTVNRLCIENIYLSVYDADGECLAAAPCDQVIQYEGEFLYEFLPASENSPAITRTIRYSIPYAKKDAGAIRLLETWIFRLYNVRFLLIATGMLSLLTGILLTVLLLCAAGHSPGSIEVRRNTFDTIPTDLIIVCYAVTSYFETIFFRGLSLDSSPTTLVFAVLILLVDAPLALLFLMSAATRLKCSTFVRDTILAFLVKLLWDNLLLPLLRGLLIVLKFIGRTLRGAPLIWKTVLGYLLLTAVEALIFAFFGEELQKIVIFWIIEKAVMLPLALGLALGLRRLQKGGQALAQGNLQYRVEEEYLPGNLLEHAQNLNSISDGMSKIVEERTKSERFRTELITNVSHDLKTPLTSIINYVDLLKKEPCASEAAKGYLNVLDRQSARLKKLVEDLVEASKASTGNVTVHPSPCELDTMLEQALGEYEERMRKNGLDPVLHMAEGSAVVNTDGRLLWRVFDNLLNNILKYAMPGTRVYLDLFLEDDEVTASFRNISVAPLNLPPEELMERFVRGDSSRHTEGSGLGLSIARSLTELMGGKMKLTIDGDLFKVSLTFPAYHAPEAEDAPAEAPTEA